MDTVHRSCHHGDLRRALVEAGTAPARAGGPDAVVLREVTRQVGVTVNAAYRHFADRDALVQAVCSEAQAAVALTMEAEPAALEPTGDDRADARAHPRAVGTGYLRFASTEPGLFLTAFSVPDDLRRAASVNSAGDSGRTPFQLLAGALDEMVAAGVLDPGRRPGAEFLAWSAVHGMAVLALGGPLRGPGPTDLGAGGAAAARHGGRRPAGCASMTASARRVVVTGALGSIGRAITPALSDRWDLRPTDVLGGDVDALDVTDAQACRAAFAGADAVVHLAAVPDPEASWQELLPANVIGSHQIAQAAIDCGVPRLVLASSLQAVSAYPEGRQVRTTDPPRPANLYGATKGWVEALGAWVASTSTTTVVALRIGYFAQRPPGGPAATARDVAAWLSPRDCTELVRAAVEADVEGFVVANGISANRYRFADLAETTAILGYRPVDDAWSGR